jgi:hypothetical protein
MQRLIEQLADEGEIFRQGQGPLGRVRYHLSVYQQFSEATDEPVPASMNVEGHVTPVDDFVLTDFHRQRSELTLRLADGRAVDFSITHADGTIRSTGRGLHQGDA